MTEERLKKLARGFRKRTLVTPRIAARTGLGALRGSGQMDAAAAEKLADELGRLKGLGMKIGQMASYLEGTLPPEAQRVLAALQSDTVGVEYSAIEPVIVESLGQPVDRAFSAFSRRPFAAASIGQVHLAEHDGQAVAVKVQYPGIRRAFAQDLKTFGRLARVALAVVPGDGKGTVDELRARFEAECDYRAEADNLRLFEQLLAPIEGASVPRLVPERCGDRVLTTAMVRGQSFAQFVESASEADRDRAAGIIFETAFGTLFRHGVFNADPHPGNYLFLDRGRVCFLDFGCVRRFDAAFIDAWKRLARSVVAHDRPRFRTLVIEMGFIARPRKFDWDHQWACMQYLYQPFLTPGFRYTAEYVARSYDILIRDNPNKMRLSMPPEWLFTNRLQWGLNSVLARLGGRADWPELWRAAIESPTEIP